MIEILALVYASLVASLIVPLLRQERLALSLSFAGSASFAVASLLLYARGGGEFYGGLVRHDSFTSLLLVGASISAILSLIASGRDALRWPTLPAFHSLVPLTLFGLFFLAGSNNVMTVIASWLLVSVASYVIIATPGNAESRVAAVKYIYVGVIATILLALWAPAYVYETGELAITRVASEQPLLIFPLLLAALGFKLGVVPFHWWLPSVYGKADGRSVAFVAGAVKLGFIAVIVRVLEALFGGSQSVAAALAAISVITMTYGNVAALTATDLQRMLAYSSVAQVGYIIAGLAVVVYADGFYRTLALAGIALLSLAYAFSKVPLFSALGGGLRESGLSGDRASAISSAALLASLLGVPPLLGFWGKLFVFIPLATYSLPLLIIALINSGISSVYYVKALRDIVTKAGNERIADEYRIVLLLGAILIVLLGILAPLLFV